MIEPVLSYSGSISARCLPACLPICVKWNIRPCIYCCASAPTRPSKHHVLEMSFQLRALLGGRQYELQELTPQEGH